MMPDCDASAAHGRARQAAYFLIVAELNYLAHHHLQELVEPKYFAVIRGSCPNLARRKVVLS
jgi:hypothetical protein